MQVIWRESARASLRAIITYIADRNNDAPASLDERMQACAERLREHPFLHRPGRVEGAREIVVHPQLSDDLSRHRQCGGDRQRSSLTPALSIGRWAMKSNAAFILLCVAVSGCVAKQDDWIVGTARMAENGTVTLDIASKERSGPIAHGHFVDPPTDARYGAIMKHVGALQPGQT